MNKTETLLKTIKTKSGLLFELWQEDDGGSRAFFIKDKASDKLLTVTHSLEQAEALLDMFMHNDLFVYREGIAMDPKAAAEYDWAREEEKFERRERDRRDEF